MIMRRGAGLLIAAVLAAVTTAAAAPAPARPPRPAAPEPAWTTDERAAFDFVDDDDLMRAYRALLTSAMAHELAHHIYFARPGAAEQTRMIDILDIETEAMEFELAFMDHLVEHGDVDRSWRDGVDRLYAAFDDALPDAARLPDGGHGQRALALFTEAYLTVGASFAALPPGVGTPAIDASFRRFAGYMIRRAELVAGKRRRLEALIVMANDRLAAGP